MGMFGAYTEEEFKVRAEKNPRLASIMGYIPLQDSWKHNLFAGSNLLYYKPGFFSRFRALDGYLGVLGIIFFYKVMAVYFNTVDVLSLCLMIWGKNIVSIGIYYYPWPEKGGHSFRFSASLWNLKYDARPTFKEVPKV